MQFDLFALAGFGSLCAIVFRWWTSIDLEGQRLEINVPSSSSFSSCWSYHYKGFRK